MIFSKRQLEFTKALNAEIANQENSKFHTCAYDLSKVVTIAGEYPPDVAMCSARYYRSYLPTTSSDLPGLLQDSEMRERFERVLLNAPRGHVSIESATAVHDCVFICGPCSFLSIELPGIGYGRGKCKELLITVGPCSFVRVVPTLLDSDLYQHITRIDAGTCNLNLTGNSTFVTAVVGDVKIQIGDNTLVFPAGSHFNTRKSVLNLKQTDIDKQLKQQLKQYRLKEKTWKQQTSSS